MLPLRRRNTEPEADQMFLGARCHLQLSGVVKTGLPIQRIPEEICPDFRHQTIPSLINTGENHTFVVLVVPSETFTLYIPTFYSHENMRRM